MTYRRWMLKRETKEDLRATAVLVMGVVAFMLLIGALTS